MKPLNWGFFNEFISSIKFYPHTIDFSIKLINALRISCLNKFFRFLNSGI